MLNATRGLAAASFALTAACSIDSRTVTVDAAIIEGNICTGERIEEELITDFSDAIEADGPDGTRIIRFNLDPGRRGGLSYVYSAPGQTPPRLSLDSSGGDVALRVQATPGVPNSPDNFWSGFGIGWGRDEEICIDASSYRGVRFTIEGTTGTCQLMFQVSISQDYALWPGTKIAACALGDLCYPPYSQALVIGQAPRTYEIAFTAISDGNPVRVVDPKTIAGIGWKLWAPLKGTPCEVNLLVDNVAFYR